MKKEKTKPECKSVKKLKMSTAMKNKQKRQHKTILLKQNRRNCLTHRKNVTATKRWKKNKALNYKPFSTKGTMEERNCFIFCSFIRFGLAVTLCVHIQSYNMKENEKFLSCAIILNWTVFLLAFSSVRLAYKI